MLRASQVERRKQTYILCCQYSLKRTSAVTLSLYLGIILLLMTDWVMVDDNLYSGSLTTTEALTGGSTRPILVRLGESTTIIIIRVITNSYNTIKLQILFSV